MMRKPLLYLLTFLMVVSCSAEKVEKSTLSFDAASLEALNGCNVAVQLGSVYDLAFTDSGMNLMRLANTAEIFTALQTGAADYALISDTHIVGLDVDSLGFKINFDGFAHGEVGVGFRHSDQALRDEFNTFLAELKETGVYDEMYDRWSSMSAYNTFVPKMELPTEGKVLNVGILNVNYPFTFLIGNELSGLEIEMMNRFSVWSGHPLNLIDMEFASVIAGLVTGKIDIIVESMIINEERARKVLFSDSYFDTQGVCLSRIDAESGVNDETGFIASVKKSFINNLVVENRWKLLIDGFFVTLEMSILSIIFGTLFSFVVCGLLLSGKKSVRKSSTSIFKLIGGIPMVVVLMILFYVVFSSSSISGETVGIIGFSILFGIEIGNLLTTNISNINKGQTEAARALGAGKYMTFFLIILPQAIKKVVPVFKTDVGELIKNTSIVGYIAVQDITKVSDIIRSRTFDAFFPLIIITLLYFLLVWLFKKVVDVIFVKFV